VQPVLCCLVVLAFLICTIWTLESAHREYVQCNFNYGVLTMSLISTTMNVTHHSLSTRNVIFQCKINSMIIFYTFSVCIVPTSIQIIFIASICIQYSFTIARLLDKKHNWFLNAEFWVICKLTNINYILV